jgi:4-aminobutyrate aminotransferase-like enzyme
MKIEKLFTVPCIRTEPPGPKTKELLKRKSLTFLRRESPKERGVAVKRSYNAIIEDLDGNAFLSFSSSINAVGFNHPKVIEAVQKQIQTTSGGAGQSVPFIECTENLKKWLPARARSPPCLFHSGALTSASLTSSPGISKEYPSMNWDTYVVSSISME